MSFAKEFREFAIKGNVVDLQCAGKGEANRSLRLWHLKRQPVPCCESMLLRDNLDEQLMMTNGDSRQQLVSCIGNAERPMAEKHDKDEMGNRDYPASDLHQKSFSIRDRRAQAE